jgi:hypothetical protein
MNPAITEILDTMDIPENRKTDTQWLIRNVGIKNRNHPEYNKLIMLLSYESINSDPLKSKFIKEN